MRRCAWMFVVMLGGCAAPGRESAHSTMVVREGTVAPADAGVMADCLMDGFGHAHWMMTNTRVAQQRRSDGLRVETYTGNTLLISADVFDDGRVALTEMSNAKLVNTSGEREAFAACLAHFRSPPIH
jgi:hypothetical protein